MRIDMIVATLRIIFVHKNHRVAPKATVRDCLDDLTERQIVVRDLRPWRRRSAGMIVRQIEQMETWPNAARLCGDQFSDESIRPKNIRNVEIPPWHIGRTVWPQRSDPNVLHEMNRAGVVREILVDLRPRRAGRR